MGTAIRRPARFDAVVVRLRARGPASDRAETAPAAGPTGTVAPPDAAAIAALAAAWARDGSEVSAHWSPATGEAYLYRSFPAPLPLSVADLHRACESARRWLGAARWDAQAARLQRVFETPGRSAGAPASNHYVVETDTARGWMRELGHWYDEEHMPGLAAVPGCVRARRFLNWDAGPRSLACYDLVAAGTLETPEWLAVRATDWSARVRPNFRNTRRTMFETLHA